MSRVLFQWPSHRTIWASKSTPREQYRFVHLQRKEDTFSEAVIRPYEVARTQNWSRSRSEEDEDEKELTIIELVDFMRKKIDVRRYFSIEVPDKEPKTLSIRIVRNPSDYSKGQMQMRAAHPG
ncbi:MAG: hypothetical protein M1839_001920 [Geoglossum umbratile]|nr:MAG: hypothetical protein M1839_001920 [Geoglossum umbratile]